jgi:hypothetical protein
VISHTIRVPYRSPLALGLAAAAARPEGIHAPKTPGHLEPAGLEFIDIEGTPVGSGGFTGHADQRPENSA